MNKVATPERARGSGPKAAPPRLPGPPPQPPRPPVDPRFRRRWAEARRAEGRRRLRALVAMACAAAAVGAGAAVLHSPLLAVHRVEVTGNRHTPRALVLAAAGLSGRRGPVPMVDVGGPVARKAVEALPWVLSASFHLSWPWTVIVKVRERAPAALVRTASGTCLVDAKGRVLEVLGTGGRPPAVPVVEGAVGAPPGEAVRPARRLSQAELADLLKAAASSPSGLSRRGLELTWGPGGLVAYAGPARTPVLLGPPTELAFKLEVLAELEAAVPLRSYAEADLSVPERPALTPKP